jgi:hypothetical protein
MASADLRYPQVNVDYRAVADMIADREYQPDTNDRQSLQRKILSKLSDVWPEPPPDGHIHVFISLRPVDSPILNGDGECFMRLLPLAQDI